MTDKLKFIFEPLGKILEFPDKKTPNEIVVEQIIQRLVTLDADGLKLYNAKLAERYEYYTRVRKG
jgi:hypothetical protein